MEAAPVQVFIRNEQGKVWGPLELPTVTLLIDNKLVAGRVQVSRDGVNFVYPGQLPGIRDAFPRELWGDVIAPGPMPAAEPSGPPTTLVLGGDEPPMSGTPFPVLHPVVASAAGPAGVPVAGPGAAPIAGPGAMPIAGPGARAAAGVPAQRPPPAAAPANPTEGIPPSGDLAQVSLMHLYYLAAAGNLTGLLALRLPDRVIEIHFRKGNPEHVESSHPDDSITSFLLKAGLAAPDQIELAHQLKARYGGDVVGALFGIGILNPTTAMDQLGQRALGVLIRAAASAQGSFTFEPKELPPGKAMPLGNRWSVLSDVVRRIPGSEVKRRLQRTVELPVLRSNGRVSPSELRLTPQEARAAGYLDGTRSLAQLWRDLPQEAETIARLVLLLKEVELASFAAVRAPPPKPPPEQPAPARPAAPPAPSAPPPAPAVAAGTPVPRPAQPLPVAAPQPTQPPRPAQPPPPGVPRPAQPPVAAPPRPAQPPPAAAPRPAQPPPAGAPRPAQQPPAAAPRPVPLTAVAAPPAAAPRPPPQAAPTAGNPPPVLAAPPPVAAPRPPPQAAPVAAPAPAPAAAAAPGSGNELAQLRKLAEELKGKTHFDVLGLTEKADAAAVKVAYFKLARQYHPDTVQSGSPPELAKLKGDIFAAVGEAYRTLSDEKARAQYLEELKHGSSKVDVAQILRAEDLFQKGCIQVKSRKFVEAVKTLDEAIAANPEEGEFYAWRGFARFFAVTDRKQGQAEGMKDIAECLKRNERCAPAHYFSGQIAKLTGDAATAARHFKRVVEIQPDHVDAQRELRMMGKK